MEKWDKDYPEFAPDKRGIRKAVIRCPDCLKPLPKDRQKMKDYTKTPIDRIYKTEAYDELEAFCDDEQGGSSDFMLCDKYDRQQVVNLLIPIIRKEYRNKNKGEKK